MFDGVFAMLSPAFLFLSGTLYLLSSLTGSSTAFPAPAPEAVARAPIWSDNLRRGSAEDKQRQHGQLGAVASESDICSGMGTDMLKMGGNAADAVSITPTLS